jgi:hypothetical protein
VSCRPDAAAVLKPLLLAGGLLASDMLANGLKVLLSLVASVADPVSSGESADWEAGRTVCWSGLLSEEPPPADAAEPRAPLEVLVLVLLMLLLFVRIAHRVWTRVDLQQLCCSS